MASEPKSFASLGPLLLARKGAASPAMKSQIGSFGTIRSAEPEELSASPIQAGDEPHFEDHGPIQHEPETDFEPEGPEGQITNSQSFVQEAPESEPARPEILNQREQLVTRVADMEPRHTISRQAKLSGRRAAFTLRLDADRHLRLRLASTLAGQSAQQIVTEALDRFLEQQPEIETLAAQIRRS